MGDAGTMQSGLEVEEIKRVLQEQNESGEWASAGTLYRVDDIVL